MTDETRLLAQLRNRSRVDEAAIERALVVREATGGELPQILATLGLVSFVELAQATAAAADLPAPLDLAAARAALDPDLLERFPYERAIAARSIPLHVRDGELTVVTDRPGVATTLAELRDRFAVETIRERSIADDELTGLIAFAYRDALQRDAVLKNHRRDPRQSARAVFTRAQLAAIGVTLFALIGLLDLNVRLFLTVLIALLQLFFLGGVAFKAWLSIVGARNELQQPIDPSDLAAIDERTLPVYSILVPVYKEPEVVGRLVTALAALDYPKHKLDVIVLLEADDGATLEALRRAEPPANWRLIVVPDSQPRTKPKACNYGLFFARGEYLVIYDAEDLPDPAQLRTAVAAFRKNALDYVCFQAALNYFNARENLLTRMFTLEYSYWFDYLIPGLDRLRLPIPLGGTSNHFDVAKLRKLGGWDPFNTTEDADLGIRACVEGYRVGYINSTTYEEANSEFKNWIRQRSRWVKGYLQTFLVYWRDPVDLWRRIGWRNFIAFNFFIGGTVFTSLASPPLWGLFFVWLVTRTHIVEPLFPDVVLYMALGNLLFGNFLGIFLNMIAIFLRRNYALMPFALLNPLYWMLHSLAAYKALWQLFTRPFYWEKTRHGLTRIVPPPPVSRAAVG